MKVKGKRRSDKMRDFIDRVYTLIGETQKLSKDAKEYPRLQANHEKLKEKYEQMKSENVEFRKRITKLTKDKDSLMNTFSKLDQKKRKPTSIYRPSETESPQANKEAEPSPTIKEEPKEVQTLRKQGDYFTCPRNHKACGFEELPCIVNPMFSCSNKVCEQQVLALIK